jgi:glutathione S-transferase
MPDIEIFGFAPSTYTQTVILAAREKGVKFTLSPVDFGSDSHRALHPFAKMPAMTDGAVHLYESTAIASYIDEAFDGPSLQPADPEARARMRQFLSAAVDYFYRPLVRDTLGHMQDGVSPDPGERDRVLDLLDAAAEGGDYLVGDRLTLADLMVAPMVRFHLAAPGNGSLLDARPHLAAWFDRLRVRESFRLLEAA